MPKTIQQSVKFSVPPDRLFGIYMDPRKHAAAINSTVSVNRKVGGRFTAFGGMLRGTILAIVPGRMIVQSWRGSDWRKSELDSILVLTFDRAPGGARLGLIHANIPDRRSASIQRGWHSYYWKPWRAYLRKAKGR
jgi:activator of HSP90 ATPase